MARGEEEQTEKRYKIIPASTPLKSSKMQFFYWGLRVFGSSFLSSVASIFVWARQEGTRK